MVIPNSTTGLHDRRSLDAEMEGWGKSILRWGEASGKRENRRHRALFPEKAACERGLELHRGVSGERVVFCFFF